MLFWLLDKVFCSFIDVCFKSDLIMMSEKKKNPVKSLSCKSLTKLTISWNEYTEQYHKAN